MKAKKLLVALTCLCASLGAFSVASAAEYTQLQDNVVKRETPAAPRDAGNTTFTGAVKHLSMFGTTDDTTYTGSYVFFSPGSRSFWHTHPGGQRLIVVKGTLWTQSWGQPKVVAHEGDTVWCPPGVKHWHGASLDEEAVQMTFTEMRDGKNVTWMEPVTDAQYNS